jgi:hypothetical protein
VSARQHAPATERNREPILAVLSEVLPASGVVLEIASGTGQHTAFFAAKLPALIWQPSDPDPIARASIAAWTEGVPNVRPPLDLDVMRRPWPVRAGEVDAILNINMIHISPWEACEALLEGAAELLPAGGLLYMYGPYRQTGRTTAPSNESFDQSLRDRNPTWGLRNLDDVARTAARHGLALERIVEMPANNLSVIYRNA